MEGKIVIEPRPVKAKFYASIMRRSLFARLSEVLPVDEIKKLVGVINAKIFEIVTDNKVNKEGYIVPVAEIEVDAVTKSVKDLRVGVRVLEEKELHMEDVDIEEMLEKIARAQKIQ